MVATGTALLLAGLAGAGATAAGSAINAKAAGDAADKQGDTAQKALDLQKLLYEQQRSDRMPYTQSGAGALSNLNALLGVKTGPAPRDLLAASGQFTPPPVQNPYAKAPVDPFAAFNGKPSAPQNMATLGQPNQPMSPQGGSASTVMMRAPRNPDGSDGGVQAVPADRVAHYQQLGAQVVG